MYLRDTTYLSHPRQEEKDRAQAILAKCLNKPIRKVTSEFLGNADRYRCVSRNPITASPAESIRVQEKAESRQLQTMIVSHLLEHGPTTGKELARILDTSVGKIGKAVTHPMIGRSKGLDPVSKAEGLLFYIRRSA